MWRAALSRVPLRSGISLGATLGARVIAALGGLALSYWLARAAGAEGLGRFTYIQSILLALVLLARVGTDQSLLRLVATLNEHGKGGAASRYFFCGLAMAFTLAVIIASLAVPIARLGLLNPEEISLLAILIWALPPLIVLSVTSGYFRGQRMVALGMLIDAGSISGVTTLLAWAMKQTSVAQIALLFVWASIAFAIAMLVLTILLARHLYGNNWLDRRPADAPSMGAYLCGGWQFAVIAVTVYSTQPGAFALGGPAIDDRTMGLLRAAERLAVLIGFALTAISPFAAPRVAAAYASRGVAGIRPAYRSALLISVIAATPPAMAIGIFGERLLRVFGPGFEAAFHFLLIMGTAQFIQACLGSSNVILAMAGRQRSAMLSNLTVLVAGCIIFPVSSHLFGGYGFAFAYLLLIGVREAINLKAILYLFRVGTTK